MGHLSGSFAVIVGMALGQFFSSPTPWEGYYQRKERKRKAEILKRAISLSAQQPSVEQRFR